jgi:hypothetical protein
MSGATMTKVTESVKESLLGVDLHNEEQLSASAKATFARFARKDEATGELVMGQEEFVNAIAPPDEDFVRRWCARPAWLTGAAQDQARTVQHSLPRGGPQGQRRRAPARLRRL